MFNEKCLKCLSAHWCLTEGHFCSKDELELYKELPVSVNENNIDEVINLLITIQLGNQDIATFISSKFNMDYFDTLHKIESHRRIA